MSDPNVRELGRVDDIDGGVLVVGVDYDAVNVDGRRLDRHQCEEFAQLFTRACWEAARYRPEPD